MIEWPEAESAPTKYFLSTPKRQTSLRKLVYAAKGRWPIERDYEELKDIGMGALRSARLAGLSSPRDDEYRRICFSDDGARAFSPAEIIANRDGRSLAYPEVADPNSPPMRPERHNPTSIAAMQKESGVMMAKRVPRCPFCQKSNDLM